VNIHRSVGMFLAGTCVACIGVPAAAQNVPQGPTPQQQKAATGQDQTNSENVIITATKRPQVLLDVPQSVSVVSGATLEQQHATNFQDYLKLIPGLQLTQASPGEGRLIVRGLNTGGVASTVGVYVDESPFGSSTGLVNGAVLAGDFDTFDLNRIEVLRGPQGTLYGASSLGGVLRFVTNAPSTAGLEARARFGMQAVDNGDVGPILNAMVNVPITSTIAFRASGSYRKDPGFINSIGTGGSDVAKGINDDRVYGGRASLLFKPSSAATIRLTAIAQNIDTDEPTIIEADPVTLRPVHGLVESRFVPQFSNLHYRLYNATGTFDLGFANLTTSTTYSKQDQKLRNDLTFALSGLRAFLAPIIGPNEFIEPQLTNLTKFTQEVRLSGQTHFADWLVGGYYAHEKGFLQQDFTPVVPGTVTPIDVVPIFGEPLAHLELPSKYKEIAGFADATLHLTQQFDLQFGGRYSKNNQSSRQTVTSLLLGNSDDFGRSSEHVFTYSVAPKYKLNQNTTIYARVAKGFRPGGPNAIAPNAPADLRTYHSDTVVSWEAGVKAETPDHRFSIDTAAFHIDWKNIQLFTSIVVIDPITGNPINFNVNSNGPSAKSDGVELTATARPVPGLDLSLNGAYTNARLAGDTPADVGGRKGDRLPFTPKLSFAANADYHWLLSPGVRAHVGGSYRYLSSQRSDFIGDVGLVHTPQLHIHPYAVVDLNAGLDFGRFDVEAYVKNLGNSHGVTSVTGVTTPIFPNGAIGTGIIRPRTIGLSLGINY